MKSAYLHIHKLVIRFIAIFALAGAVAVPSAVSQDKDPGASKTEAETALTPSRALSIGPGRVAFRLTAAGEWLGLVSGWSDGEDVITGGGFVVLARNAEGDVIEVANSSTGRLEPGEHGGKRDVVYEGVRCGARYPLANRDDDDDGREDEDRLDGIDNDNDGQTDEDYAAVGDEMITLGFKTHGPKSGPAVEFHQECYAWSLPHIDGMVAMKLVVKNTSETPLRDIRIGSLINKPGEYSVETQDMTSRENNEKTQLTAKGILLGESGETSVAVLFFADPAESDDEASWLTGVAGRNRNLADLVSAATYSENTQEEDKALASIENGKQITKGTEDNNPEKTANAGRMAYGVSPNLGNLQPGDEIVVYTVLVAVPPTEPAERAIEDAYRTVIGDGTHRMIPPPVSITCRMIWGTYRKSTNQDQTQVVAVTLENLRAHGFGVSDISYLEGIDVQNAVARDAVDGNVDVILPGKPPEVFTGGQNRVVLSGRLRSGEYFEVILRPDASDKYAQAVSDQDADLYWATTGKLDESYLTGSPNPFREATTVYYEVPAQLTDEESGVLSFINPVQTSVKVYNVAGRLVDVLVDAVLTPGIYDTHWDGTDDNGRGVASGVYYVKLQIGKRHVTKRLIQLK